jgi:hypothetical protein
VDTADNFDRIPYKEKEIDQIIKKSKTPEILAKKYRGYRVFFSCRKTRFAGFFDKCGRQNVAAQAAPKVTVTQMNSITLEASLFCLFARARTPRQKSFHPWRKRREILS